MNVHSNSLKERWFSFSLAEQLGNIGSEVGRAIKRKQEGQQEYFEKAFDRALELFDLTISDKRWSTLSRLRELTRAREVFCDFVFGENHFNSTPESLDRYFIAFSFAARMRR